MSDQIREEYLRLLAKYTEEIEALPSLAAKENAQLASVKGKPVRFRPTHGLAQCIARIEELRVKLAVFDQFTWSA